MGINISGFRLTEGVRQSLLVSGGNTAAQGLSAIALILLSRSLGPDLFGEFMVGFALVLILSRINDLGLTFAQQRFVPRTKDYSKINRIFSYAARSKLLVSMAIFITGILITPWLADLLNFENAAILYLSFGLNLVTVAYEQLAAMLQSLHRFPQAVSANAIQAGSKMIGAIGLVMMGLVSAVGAFVAYMGAPIVSIFFAPKLLGSKIGLKLRGDYTSERSLMKKMAGHSAVGFMAAGIIENIDILLVQGYLNEYDTGLFGGVSRIALVISMIGFSLATVLNPRVARYTAKIDMDAYLKKAGGLIGLCVLGFLVIIPLAGLMIYLTVGPEYVAGIEVLIVLLAGAFLLVASVPMIATFFAFPKAEWYFSVSGVMQLVAIVALNVWLIPQFGVMGAAWARLLSRIVLFSFTGIMMVWFYRKTFNSRIVSA